MQEKNHRPGSQTESEQETQARANRREQAGESPEQIDESTWKERYLRLRADLENTRKRLERNAAQRIEMEQDRLLRDMLPLADNLERVIGVSGLGGERPQEGCERIREGVALSLHDFYHTLEKFGVVRIEALNQPFDPNLHEARGIAQNAEAEEGVVVQVLLNGYLRDGRLLRPAQVLVSAA